MIEDTKQKLGQDYMAVKTDSFALLTAFKEECEKMGWIYNERFTRFDEDKYSAFNEHSACLYYSFDFDDMEGKPAFAISSTQLESYSLPTQWYSALDSARQMLMANRHKFSVVLNEDYTAVVDTKLMKVRVGCQEFPFSKVLELANIIIINKNSKTGQTFADQADIKITFNKK